MSKRGIDVSEFNGVIDWDKVKASGLVDFAILRCSLGWTDGDVNIRRDKRFLDNVFGCEMAGIPYGVYHYSYCLKPENEIKEAEYVIRNLEGFVPTLGVWFDIEANEQIPLGKANLTKMTKTFCDTLKAAGREPGVYSYLSWLNNYLDMDALKDYPVWLAQTQVKKPTYKGDIAMWQYAWNGKIPGINGAVDLDELYVDSAQKIGYNDIVDYLSDIIDRLQKLREDISTWQSM